MTKEANNDELVQLRTPTRRDFLKVVGGTVALAGCARDLPEKILPYSKRPREVTPGIPTFYATSMMIDGWATGLLVESHEGRPTKIEGNPEHPASRGATGLWHQASIFQLYDPGRAHRVRHQGSISNWETLLKWLRSPRSDAGAGLRLLLEPNSSPLVAELLARVKARHPQMKITFWQPIDQNSALEGARLAFGQRLQPRFDLSRADVILALDADLLTAMPDFLRHSRDWSARRHLTQPEDPLNRLYAVEPMVSDTGSVADHRLRCRVSELLALASHIAVELGLDVARPPIHDDHLRWTKAVARDLKRGPSLIVAGPRLPPALHALVYAMNDRLGSFGKTLTLHEPIMPAGDQDLATLTGELQAGKVDTLIIADANPVYAAPAELDFGKALARANQSFYLGLYENETAQSCSSNAPSLHFLESWGDGRAPDGTLSLVQPLVRPLFDGRQLETVLSALADGPLIDPHWLLTDSLTRRGIDVESAISRGLVEGAFPDVRAPLRWSTSARDFARVPPAAAGRLELTFIASSTVGDGRYANNAWLQETPQPITKLTWDNAALLSQRTAARLDLMDEDLIEIEVAGRHARTPVLVVPGHADDCLTLVLGYGRSGGEEIASSAGFNLYPIRSGDPVQLADRIRKIGRHRLARTQEHFHSEDIALRSTLESYRKDPLALTANLKGPLPSLLPDVEYEGTQWAMSIDLSLCTGCSACTMACYSENNNLVVGKDQVLNRRNMDWLRIDTYREDEHFVHQPMMCQHCEMAPCEYVCPVNATVHSPDGLNEMVYNRCVGTRFCSNNCPYKVRRFNWFDWTDRVPANQGLVELRLNPDVTVRERGVMEKCTYCVQRIREAEIHASVEKQPLVEPMTACQQACPTRAIQFGSLDRDNTMSAWRKQQRSYAVLHDQNTRPRTMYLARIDNPNPELE
jgi:molybdopterin-containing oxidoreductase family iron-sulfur binding subunit